MLLLSLPLSSCRERTTTPWFLSSKPLKPEKVVGLSKETQFFTLRCEAEGVAVVVSMCVCQCVVWSSLHDHLPLQACHCRMKSEVGRSSSAGYDKNRTEKVHCSVRQSRDLIMRDDPHT